MRLRAVPILSFGAVASSGIAGVWGLNLELTRRAFSSSSFGSVSNGFHFSSSLGASDVKEDPTNLGNVMDMRYTTNITINGKEIIVALDTGSTDLWVAPPGGLGNFNDTKIPLNLLYGDGSYGVSGTIAVDPFKFGNYSIARQAYLNANGKATITGFLELGIYGLLGLSFNVASASPINAAVHAVYGPEATWGKSVLDNIFEQHPDEPNFIAIDLARTDDLEDTSGGSFGIGEYDSRYLAVKNAPKLAQFPKGGDRWTTLLEGIKVDGVSLPMNSTISKVPKKSMLALLDTGDPAAILPMYLFNGIYGKIPGAVSYEESGTGIWIVPCNATTSVSFIFGDKEYPIHPLDLTQIVDDLSLGDSTYSACISAIKGVDNWSTEYDISLGDSFLRNVYSVFDFGDPQSGGSVGPPYMQLLAQTDPKKAAAEVQTIRSRTMSGSPPEVNPTTLYSLLMASGASGSAAEGSPSNSTTTQPGKSTSTPTSAGDSESAEGSSAAGIGTGGYSIAVIALLSANLIVTIIVAAFAILNFISRGSRTSGSPPAGVWAKKKGAYAPVGEHYEDKMYNAPA